MQWEAIAAGDMISLADFCDQSISQRLNNLLERQKPNVVGTDIFQAL
jgi:hypothetical protein